MINVVKKLSLGVFLAAVFGTFAYMSVYGLKAFMANQPIVAIIFGSGLEACKLALVVGTHQQWPTLDLVSRIGRCFVIGALIITTSAGVLGFMWLSHNVSTSGFQRLESRKAALEIEARAIKEELDTLDATIANWPDNWVTKKLQARESIQYNEKQARLQEIRRDLEGLAVNRTIEYSGPVFATATIIKWMPNKIAKWWVVWLTLLGEAGGFWMMVLNSRAWSGEKPKREHGEAGEQGNNKNREIKIDIEAKTIKNNDTDSPERAVESGPGEHPSVTYLKQIQASFGLTVAEIADITKRKKLMTVEKWLTGNPVPEKSMRLMRHWAAEKM